MRPPRTLPALVHVLGIAVLAIFGSVSEAAAQGAPLPANTIVSVAPTDSSPSDARVLLTVNPAVPQFSIMGNDANTALIAFADTRLAPNLLFAGGRHGPFESMVFAQNNNMLTLTFSGAHPLHLTAASIAGRAIALTITSGAASSAAPEAAPSTLASHPEPPADEVFDVVPLRYADVSEIVGLLTANQSIKPNDNFTPQEPAFGSAGMQGGYAGVATPTFNSGLTLTGPATESVGQSVDDVVGVDRRLNAIVLKGPAARVARLKAQIARLDVPVTSVVLETVFVELTQTGARNVGLDFNNGASQVATVAYSYAAGDFPGVANTARTGGVNVNLQAAIYAQIAKGEGRIISKPRIAAQSGSTAKIITGDALPILTSIALSGVNAVQQQVQYVNVGVTLQIAPRVSDDGFVTSHVFAEVSSVTGYSQGYPTISQREASTSATVRDGDAFVIGGLTQESDLAHHNKIPVAGDVPVLGKLFSSENSTKAKTELYIVVTPHVVRGRDAAAALLLEKGVVGAVPSR